MKYEVVIGLEVHVQLKTNTKAFCGCSTEFGKEPNSQVCPVCLGFPGSLPALNRIALEYAIRVGLALNCQVQEFTKFDRKHYYYPDLPKNFQISQYDLPISKEGFLNIALDKQEKRIGIRRVHLEEDAGKLIHRENSSWVDFNRAGVPLLEVVSEPQLNSPAESYEYLTALKGVLEYLDVSDCDMEKGSLRCDANISLREKGAKELGTKSELKNMNSFKAVRDALGYEIERQAALLDEGGKVIQETRLWDEKEMRSVIMRTKEEAKDYRYFPEPDLTPFILNKEDIAKIKSSLPELPKEKSLRLMKEYGLTDYEAGILVVSKKDAQFAEDCLLAFPAQDKKLMVNWLIGPMLSEANSRALTLTGLRLSIKDLVELLQFLQRQEISNLSAKAVLTEMIDTAKPPQSIIKEKNLLQISNASALDAVIDEVINENAKSVNDFKAGKENALMFLVGQAMKKSRGKANPKVIQEMLKGRLPHV